MENEELLMIIVAAGILLIGLILVLMLPVTGTIFGMTVSLPIIGWIALAAFAVIALVVFFKALARS